MASLNEVVSDSVELDASHLVSDKERLDSMKNAFKMIVDAAAPAIKEFGEAIQDCANSVHEGIIASGVLDDIARLFEDMQRARIARSLSGFRLGWVAWRLPRWVVRRWPKKWIGEGNE